MLTGIPRKSDSYKEISCLQNYQRLLRPDFDRACLEGVNKARVFHRLLVHGSSQQ